jgi:hypothetical protein
MKQVKIIFLSRKKETKVLISKSLLFRFEDFDFHKECAGMRYDRLAILLARIVADQDDYG